MFQWLKDQSFFCNWFHLLDKSFHQVYVDRVPLERMATMSDYNGAILFLCSQASRYMTGANLVVDEDGHVDKP